MKKLLLSTAICAAFATSAAPNYVIYSGDPLAANEVQIPNLELKNWSGCTVNTASEDPTSPDGYSHHWQTTGGRWFGAGWATAAFDFTDIVNGDYDLVFSAKTNLPENWPAKIKMEVVGVFGSEKNFELPRDEEWHEVRMNLREYWPDLADKYENGKEVYIFYPVSDQTPEAGHDFWFADIRLEPKDMELDINARVSSVSDTDATITYSYTLPFALEDAALTIDLLDSKGSVVATDSDNSRNFTLSGLEPSTTYAYTVRLTATPAEGETQTVETSVSVATTRPAGQESRWYGYIDASVPAKGPMASAVPVIFEYELISGADNRLTVKATAEGDINAITGLVASGVYVNNINVGQWNYSASRSFEITPETEFSDGQKVEIRFSMIYTSGGDFSARIEDFYFGTSNDRPVVAYKPAVTASATNINHNSADIAWSVSLPAAIADAEVSVTVDGKAAASSPFTLTDLSEKTAYTVEVVAKAIKDGNEYVSEPVTVTFTTTAENAEPVRYWQILDRMLDNAWITGEDESKRRTVPVSVKVEIIHNTDRTVTFNIESKADRIVGFVPFIICDPLGIGQSNMHNEGNGRYSYTTPADKTFEIGQALGNTYLRFNFAGTQCDLTMKNIIFGSEGNEAIDWGEPASINISIGNSAILKTGTAYEISSIVCDEAGHYLVDSQATYEVGDNDDAQINIADNSVTATRTGHSTIKAYIPDTSATGEITLNFIATATSGNVVTRDPQGNEKYTVLYEADADARNIHMAFDGNNGTQLVWDNFDNEKGAAGDYELLIDLGRYCIVHACEIIWEGACAREFTLNLHIPADAPWYAGADRRNTPAARRAPAAGTIDRSIIGSEPVYTYNVNDNQQVGGGFVSNLAEVGGINTRYISIKPKTKSDWGVKLAQLNVIGDENEFNPDGTPTGLADVIIDKAPSTVDVYTISGACVLRGVSNPEARDILAPGLYIIGNKKVLVR